MTCDPIFAAAGEGSATSSSSSCSSSSGCSFRMNISRPSPLGSRKHSRVSKRKSKSKEGWCTVTTGILSTKFHILVQLHWHALAMSDLFVRSLPNYLTSKTTQLCWLTHQKWWNMFRSFDDLAMPLQLPVLQSLPSNPVKGWLSMTSLHCFNRSWICKSHRSLAVKNIAERCQNESKYI